MNSTVEFAKGIYFRPFPLKEGLPSTYWIRAAKKFHAHSFVVCLTLNGLSLLHICRSVELSANLVLITVTFCRVKPVFRYDQNKSLYCYRKRWILNKYAQGFGWHHFTCIQKAHSLAQSDEARAHRLRALLAALAFEDPSLIRRMELKLVQITKTHELWRLVSARCFQILRLCFTNSHNRSCLTSIKFLMIPKPALWKRSIVLH